ncbi:hypothetical protein [Wolbachia endosymbiont of Cantharis cryptica]|uniref:hypothetical protein n=1 Tax=Wolbachia endosymbiont of Cantharis cryptica TaxID=3066132 RepID=UPI00376EBC7B
MIHHFHNKNGLTSSLLFLGKVSFGVGAGLVALGVTSPIAITISTLIANTVVVQLLISAITERSSSPPTPPGSSVDSSVKVDGTGRSPCPTN